MNPATWDWSFGTESCTTEYVVMYQWGSYNQYFVSMTEKEFSLILKPAFVARSYAATEFTTSYQVRGTVDT